MPARRRSSGITRRQGLLGLVALVPVGALASCSSEQAPDAPPTTTAAAPPPISARVAEEEAALIALYDAAIAALPAGQDQARSTLELIRRQHADHLSALGGGQLNASAEGVPGAAPQPLQASISTLLDAERQAARDRIRSCVEATDMDLSRTLAFIGASEASHVPALRDLR
jgi:hypothetical protein